MVLAQIVRKWERDALMEMEIVYIKLQPYEIPQKLPLILRVVASRLKPRGSATVRPSLALLSWCLPVERRWYATQLLIIELNIDEYLIKAVLCSPLPSEMGKMLDTE